jgi:hypothetical protein
MHGASPVIVLACRLCCEDNSPSLSVGLDISEAATSTHQSEGPKRARDSGGCWRRAPV